MARNPVQFQKGISLNEFLSLYGTEQQCFDALYRWRWPNGFVCPNCGHDRGCQLTTHKLQQCYRCHRQTSITAGTIFEATKLPLTVWFQALYLMTQDKKGCSAMKLHRHLGISYNAAWRMRHKLMQVMMERDRAHPLGGSVQLDDAYLGGERSGGKRGRGAPGTDARLGEHPAVADEHHTREGEALAQLLDVDTDGVGVGGVAVEHLDGDRAPLAVAQQAEHDLELVALSIPSFNYQMTPKISLNTRCSISISENLSINGQTRSSDQLGIWSYNINP